MSAKAQPRLSPEQYLEIERSSESRHEFYDGRMFAMAGGSFNHSRIIANLARIVGNEVDGTACVVASSDLRINASPSGLYTYADLVVVRGEPEFIDGQQDTLNNPILIGEVLSPSTEAYDRGFKFAQYRKLASLLEYVIVSQYEARIEVFRRQNSGDWLLSEYVGMDMIVPLTSINRNIPMAGVFNRIVFAPEDSNSSQPSPSS